MLRSRTIFTILIVLALLAGAIYAAVLLGNQQAASASRWQTAVIQEGSLTSTVTANGVVRSNQTQLLAWTIGGRVEQLGVHLGEQVEQGAELASLASETLPQEIILARIQLSTAQQDLVDLLDPPSNLDLAQAEKRVADAQKKLEDSQYSLKVKGRSATQQEIDHAYATIVLARKKLETIQDNIVRIQKKLNRPVKDYLFFESRHLYVQILHGLQLQETEARKALEGAQYRYDQLKGPADPTDLAIAEANLSLAQAELNDAQKTLQRLKTSPSQEDISAAQARLDAAQRLVDQARLTAPFSGTLTQVLVQPGDLVAPQETAFRLDDLSRLLVETVVSEIDINRIQPGQTARLRFDAIPGKEYEGKIVQVPPVGEQQQGVTDFTVTVEVAGAGPEIRPAMTAQVEIEVAREANVVLVPSQAIRLLEGQRVVYILDQGGNPMPVPVTLGIASTADTQLLNGDLQPGDQVILNPPAASP